MALFPCLIWWPCIACSAVNPFLLIREVLSLVCHLVLSHSLLFLFSTFCPLFSFCSLPLTCLLLSCLLSLPSHKWLYMSMCMTFCLYVNSTVFSFLFFPPAVCGSFLCCCLSLSLFPLWPNNSKLLHYYSPHECISHYVKTRSLFVNFKPPPFLSPPQSIWQTLQHLALP